MYICIVFSPTALLMLKFYDHWMSFFLKYLELRKHVYMSNSIKYPIFFFHKPNIYNVSHAKFSYIHRFTCTHKDTIQLHVYWCLKVLIHVRKERRMVSCSDDVELYHISRFMICEPWYTCTWMEWTCK